MQFSYSDCLLKYKKRAYTKLPTDKHTFANYSSEKAVAKVAEKYALKKISISVWRAHLDSTEYEMVIVAWNMLISILRFMSRAYNSFNICLRISLCEKLVSNEEVRFMENTRFCLFKTYLSPFTSYTLTIIFFSFIKKYCQKKQKSQALPGTRRFFHYCRNTVNLSV